MLTQVPTVLLMEIYTNGVEEMMTGINLGVQTQH
jgi:hypothetical protein